MPTNTGNKKTNSRISRRACVVKLRRMNSAGYMPCDIPHQRSSNGGHPRHDGLALQARDRRRGGRVFRVRGADLCELCEPKCSRSDSAGASGATLIGRACMARSCAARWRVRAHRRCSAVCPTPAASRELRHATEGTRGRKLAAADACTQAPYDRRSLSMVALSAEASTAYADPLGLSEAWRPDGERRVVEPFTTALGRAHDRSDREGP